MEKTPGVVYHEKQSMMLCAIHAVNNLLQSRGAFTKKQFDEICCRLSPDTWINPHRSMLGIGNYDINVIMVALQSHGYETVWFDKRKKLGQLCPEKIFGFLINTTSRMSMMSMPLPFQGKHWITIRRVDDTYYELDSKRSQPLIIGTSDSDVLKFLGARLSGNGAKTDTSTELLLVLTAEVFQSGSWKHDSDSNSTEQPENS